MKFDNKKLAILFALLLVIFIYQKFIKQPEVRSFDTELIKLDTSKVSKMILKNKDGQEIVLSRSDASWSVSEEGRPPAPALESEVNQLLSMGNIIETSQLVSKSQADHAKYELDENSANRLDFMAGSKMVASIMVGKFAFDPNTRTARSYARRTNEDDVYEVEGFLALSLNKKLSDFRNKAITKNLDANRLNALILDYNGTTQSISKTVNGEWVNQAHTVLDSVSSASFFNALANLSASDVLDSADFKETDKVAEFKLLGEDEEQRIKIYSNTGENDFLVTNSKDHQSIFGSDSSGIFKVLVSDFLALASGH